MFNPIAISSVFSFILELFRILDPETSVVLQLLRFLRCLGFEKYFLATEEWLVSPMNPLFAGETGSTEMPIVLLGLMIKGFWYSLPFHSTIIEFW